LPPLLASFKDVSGVFAMLRRKHHPTNSGFSTPPAPHDQIYDPAPTPRAFLDFA
jgi:hypothetical protein